MMIVRVIAAVVFVVAAGLTATAEDTPKLEFKEYVSKDGKYKVAFPGKVETEASPPVKDTVFHSAKVDVAPGRIFTVSYFDLPAELKADEAKAFLKATADNTNATGGTLHSTKETTLGPDKLPARDMLVEQFTKAFTRQRSVIAGKRLYLVLVVGPKDFVTSKDADRFVESFEVTK